VGDAKAINGPVMAMGCVAKRSIRFRMSAWRSGDSGIAGAGLLAAAMHFGDIAPYVDFTEERWRRAATVNRRPGPRPSGPGDRRFEKPVGSRLFYAIFQRHAGISQAVPR
jgi:hypothetical protein